MKLYWVISLLVLVTAFLSVSARRLDCPRENEMYACGSACQTDCRTLGEPCPIVNIRCNDDCYCKEGFARDLSGHCIPISQCPKKKEKE